MCKVTQLRLIATLLIILNVISLGIFFVTMYAHITREEAIQEGLQTYFNNNELYIK